VSPDLEAAISSVDAPGLHGLVVVRGGEVVLELYRAGEDAAWGRPLGVVAFDAGVLHDLRSVTKSVVALLYGIALDDGVVPEPDEPLLAHFPGYADLGHDPLRARLLVEHALTMSLGLEWNEDAPYTSEANSEIAMEFAPDRFRFILERPVVEEPGTRWMYSGGASALVGRLIEIGAGMTLPQFARARLFDPLGISRFEWATGADGVASAASGLRLTPGDLARVGGLVLAHGEWDGVALVPRRWLETALAPHLPIDDGLEYGYQWYLGAYPRAAGGTMRAYGAMGNGGQRLYVIPDLELVVAIAAGNYDAGSASSATPDTVMTGVLAALT
jgi:CubicO group peptidase (beta-lactamase class C family)